MNELTKPQREFIDKILRDIKYNSYHNRYKLTEHQEALLVDVCVFNSYDDVSKELLNRIGEWYAKRKRKSKYGKTFTNEMLRNGPGKYIMGVDTAMSPSSKDKSVMTIVGGTAGEFLRTDTDFIDEVSKFSKYFNV